MPKGVADLSIVRATSVHIDAFCDVWLTDHKAMQAIYRKAWDWEPFDWHVYILSQWETAAAVDPTGELEGLISIEVPNADPLIVHYLQSAPKNYGPNRTPANARRGKDWTSSFAKATPRRCRTLKASSTPWSRCSARCSLRDRTWWLQNFFT